jgi:hypothetical protein
MARAGPARGGGDPWSVVIRNQEAVLSGLAQGECDGILPDEWLEPDNLVQTALEAGFLDLFEDFPDRRQRRSIEAALFCKVLLCGRLVDAPSIAATGRVVFHSATLLDKLGFNFRMVREGGRRTGDHRPFDEEALEDFFAALRPADFFSHQVRVSQELRQHPALEGEVWVLDCQDTAIPNGHHAAGYHWKSAVLSVCTQVGPLPVLWRFGKAPETADLVLGRPLVRGAQRLWGRGVIRWLIADAGFVDGAWLRRLKQRGTDTVLRIREGMDNYEAALRQAQAAAPTAWQAVALPKRRPKERRPLGREVLGFVDQPGWEGLEVPISVCVVRDTYADRVEYWVLICTQPTLSAKAIYDLFRRRWGIEESFMALARYHGINDLSACRPGLALALIHFTLLAQVLRYLCLLARAAQRWRPRTKYLVVYWAGYYALLHASQVFAQVFDHMELWQGRQQAILEALRYCEGG